jgi:hypothetical protein
MRDGDAFRARDAASGEHGSQRDEHAHEKFWHRTVSQALVVAGP